MDGEGSIDGWVGWSRGREGGLDERFSTHLALETVSAFEGLVAFGVL
jgi:hypothetical protein